MSPNEARAQVLHELDAPIHELPGQGTVRILIDHVAGARHVHQRVFRFGLGRTPELRNEHSEEVLYVVSGHGEASLGGEVFQLEPGTGLLIPPMVDQEIENQGPHDLVLVSVLSPPPGSTQNDHELLTAGAASVHEAEQADIQAGGDRYFRLLIDAEQGSRHVTQFVGFIDRSRAPFHTHTYEEALYILEGRGIVHIDDHDLPIERGTSIFLPPGTPHCLENEGPEVLKLLGVFSPPGSPANRMDSPGPGSPGG